MKERLKERQFIFFTKHDVLLILIICTIATILNMYANPIFAAAVVVGGLLLMRVVEHREAEQKEKEENERVSIKAQYIEKRSVHDIITQKLNEGAIEKAIDERFDQLLQDVVDDVFSDSGEVAQTMKAKLKDNVNGYIEHHDFSQYNNQIEEKLHQLTKNDKHNRHDIVQHIEQLIGRPANKEVKTSKLFEKFKEYILSTTKIKTGKHLMGRMVCEDVTPVSELNERKTLTLTFEGDEEMDMIITLHRWKDSSFHQAEHPWTIEGIKRKWKGKVILRELDDITTFQTPLFNLFDLTDLEVYLLKLYYDGTSIVLDEETIEDVVIEEFIEVGGHQMAIPKIST